MFGVNGFVVVAVAHGTGAFGPAAGGDIVADH